MADTLVERLTGQTRACEVPVGVHLVMTDRSLLAGDSRPTLARALVSAAPEAASWVRRLYSRPRTGELVATESRSRRFSPGLARLNADRDRTCRTPWCDAPIRHIDHVEAHERGGPTTYANGQGLCEACNHAKQAPGWTARPDRLGPHTVAIVTPTGHRYTSRSPDPPGCEPPEGQARVDWSFRWVRVAA